LPQSSAICFTLTLTENIDMDGLPTLRDIQAVADMGLIMFPGKPRKEPRIRYPSSEKPAHAAYMRQWRRKRRMAKMLAVAMTYAQV
jgi:hypothetical protein